MSYQSSANRIVESFYQLDNCALATSTATNESNHLTRFNGKTDIFQNGNVGTSGITEIDVMQLHRTVDYFLDKKNNIHVHMTIIVLIILNENEQNY